jgi:hypothetical protein
MVVIAHQHISMHLPTRPPAHLAQSLDQSLPVPVISKNVRAAISPRHDVVGRASVFHSRSSCHSPPFPSPPIKVKVNFEGLTPETAATGIRHCISTKNGTLYYPNGGGASTSLAKEKRRPGRESPTLQSTGRVVAITGSTGAVVEQFDCDDACRPIFLTSDGIVRQGASSALTGFRWLEPAAAWDPESKFFQCDGSVYSPLLGTEAAKEKPKETKPRKEYTGHVTLMK